MSAYDHMPALSGVYRVMNAINGDSYVGSSANMRRRVSNHCCDLKSGRHCNAMLQGSYWTHGLKSFRFDVLQRVDRHDALRVAEAEWINKLTPVFNLQHAIKQQGHAEISEWEKAQNKKWLDVCAMIRKGPEWWDTWTNMPSTVQAPTITTP